MLCHENIEELLLHTVKWFYLTKEINLPAELKTKANGVMLLTETSQQMEATVLKVW